ncbi:amidohydrolase family protein [Bradyrhizobium sp. WSM 1704]|uniref:amidohydrolase family protein n=1 Tax=Bradyrhizobium semiaridum TaxID=2821404 RepID=UPI001CE28828|nr:amidohydrolase family protein [Bradyrhizobium semiaridum]MCA6123173.1 amidohydrolase family protein [Bradyrhizobium semiaridum]
MAASVFANDQSSRPTVFGRIFPPDNDWLARAPKEDTLLPDLPIIDTHHHLWDLPNFRYLFEEFLADAMTGHKLIGTVFADCFAMYRADGPVHMRPVGETEFALGVAAMSASGCYGPARVAAGMFGAADLNLGSAIEEVLQAHIAAGNGRFKGIRFATTWDASEDVISSNPGTRAHMLLEPKIRQALRKLADLKLSYDAWVYFTQLDELANTASALPDLLIIMDHCGGPLGYGPYARNKEENFARWRAGIREVARHPNVFCKLGGVLGRGAAFDYIHAERPPTSEHLAALWRPWFETCIEAFGAERCMFESNFPVDKMGVSYATLWNTFKRICAGASDTELKWLFAGTARRAYRLESEFPAI